QRRRRGGVERRAAGIVGLDAEAAQLARDPARQRAVAGDEGGRAVLQRQPERDRDGERLLAPVGRLHQRHAREDARRGPPRQPGARRSSGGGFCGRVGGGPGGGAASGLALAPLLSSPGAGPGRGGAPAPAGRREIAASRRAVAGIEPVEPAAMTGPEGGLRARRSASANMPALRWAAGLERAASASSAGQAWVTISRNSSVTCHQLARSSGTSAASRAQSAPPVSTSSISAARSRASQSASASEAG